VLHLMRLVYLSPVPWASFAQRPHKFVDWFHACTGAEVMWLDPYPTRFPALSDFHRAGGARGARRPQGLAPPVWLRCLQPGALPIEPLPGSGGLNGLIWRALLDAVAAFAESQPTMLVIGKPSVLALAVMKRLPACRSVYDAMDDFPAFYSGLSRLAMHCRERQLVRRVDRVLVSSSALRLRWSGVRADVQLVRNAVDRSVVPAAMSGTPRPTGPGKVFGYVGTIGAWFDWNWVIKLARARPADRVRLIGPAFAPGRSALPHNIEMLPPCNHRKALRAMQNFDVGLIPFLRNRLTASVDPIKFYEYRALGLPVLSTDFGEMSLRRHLPGTFLSHSDEDFHVPVGCALAFLPDKGQTRRFIADNTWEARFASAGIL